MTASCVLLLINKVAANSQERDLSAEIFIEGVSYGRLENFAKLKPLISPRESASGILDLPLDHTFIADKSLFDWARNYSLNPHTQPRDIDLVLCNKFGEEVDRYTLVQTKPYLSSIEVAESSLGGYSESIQVFVQDIIHHGQL